jgi:hypothetical protein
MDGGSWLSGTKHARMCMVQGVTIEGRKELGRKKGEREKERESE